MVNLKFEYEIGPKMSILTTDREAKFCALAPPPPPASLLNHSVAWYKPRSD